MSTFSRQRFHVMNKWILLEMYAARSQRFAWQSEQTKSLSDTLLCFPRSSAKNVGISRYVSSCVGRNSGPGMPMISIGRKTNWWCYYTITVTQYLHGKKDTIQTMWKESFSKHSCRTLEPLQFPKTIINYHISGRNTMFNLEIHFTKNTEIQSITEISSL